jgi:putative membrane protein
MTEVKAGELAGKKGTVDETKLFGEKMVKEQSAINEGLNALATQKGVTLRTSLDTKNQVEVDNLAGLPGSEFDDTFVLKMITAHQEDVIAYQTEAAATRDPDIQNFIAKSLPVVEAHLRQVGGMQKATASPTMDIKN